MAVYQIVTVGQPGDEVLRKKAAEVPAVTKKTQKLIKDMIETMYEADGAGLAAPQIGISQRILVIDVGEGPFALINPKIVQASGEVVDVEGCLSLPGLSAYVKRNPEVVVEGLNEKGKPMRITGDGLLARALQHEIDHLDGILMTDRMIAVVPDEESASEIEIKEGE